MPITGAIFDCDGTLVDSMGMWFAVFDELLARHGVKGEEGLLHELESLNYEDECQVCHDRFGIGASGRDVEDEVAAVLREKYAHEVKAFEGCGDFLTQLSDAGIPMAIATSTPVEFVRIGLDANGIGDMFDSIVSTSDVGADKDHPDVYLTAMKRLGTPQETTWVFEDAPFGAKTARDAGFHVIGLINDHDGRDPELMASICDFVARGYDELEVANEGGSHRINKG